MPHEIIYKVDGEPQKRPRFRGPLEGPEPWNLADFSNGGMPDTRVGTGRNTISVKLRRDEDVVDIYELGDVPEYEVPNVLVAEEHYTDDKVVASVGEGHSAEYSRRILDAALQSGTLIVRHLPAEKS